MARRQHLMIPVLVCLVAGTADAGPSFHVHRIAAGDTVYGLARRYGSRTRAILAENGLKPDDTLRIGREIRVPRSSAVSSSSSTRKGSSAPPAVREANPTSTMRARSARSSRRAERARLADRAASEESSSTQGSGRRAPRPKPSSRRIATKTGSGSTVTTVPRSRDKRTRIARLERSVSTSRARRDSSREPSAPVASRRQHTRVDLAPNRKAMGHGGFESAKRSRTVEDPPTIDLGSSPASVKRAAPSGPKRRKALTAAPIAAASPATPFLTPYREPKRDDAAPPLSRIIVDLFAKLAVVLGVAWLSLYMLRGIFTRRGVMPGRRGRIKVIENASLGPHQAIHLVKVAGKVLVLGSTPDRITTISVVDDPDLLHELEQEHAARPFRTQMNDALKQTRTEELADQAHDAIRHLWDRVQPSRGLRGGPGGVSR